MANDNFRLKLVEHLCEAQDPLATAKACTLQLMSLTDRFGDNEMSNNLLKWMLNIEPTKILHTISEYEQCQKLAQQIIPFIRSDLIALLEQFNCTYNKEEAVKKDCIETDGFLYEDLDEALRTLHLTSDKICSDCKSTNVDEIDFTLTSTTVQSLINLFTTVLNDDLSDKNLAVIGSGCGATVYSAFLFSKANITSYECDHRLVEAQKYIVEKYKMSSRVQICTASQDFHPSFTKDVDVLIIENITGMENTVEKICVKSFETKLNFKKNAIIISKDEHSFLFSNFLVNVQPQFSTREFHVYRIT